LIDSIKILLRKLFPPLFSINITDGEAHAVKGVLTSSFLRDCSEIAKRNGVSNGWIWGLGTREGIRLEFSGGITRENMQRFRNAAGINGYGSIRS
jgi:hypothetical protein